MLFKLSLFILLIGMLSGCLANSLGELRATEPKQTGTFQAPYEPLATCAKNHIETDSWGYQPIVHAARQTEPEMIRVWSIYGRSTLFEVTFQPISSTQTRVDYRRMYDGLGSQLHAWAIIERCAHQVTTAPLPAADAAK